MHTQCAPNPEFKGPVCGAQGRACTGSTPKVCSKNVGKIRSYALQGGLKIMASMSNLQNV